MMAQPRVDLEASSRLDGVDFAAARRHLGRFDFTGLFVDVLNWNSPPDMCENAISVEKSSWQWSWIAEMEGVAVAKMHCQGQLPDRRMRRKLHKAFQRLHHEHLLVFVDDAAECKRSLWSWQKSSRFLREHYFSSNQAGDLFLSKLEPLFIDLSDLDESGQVKGGVRQVADRLQQSLDVERVSKRFYGDFSDQHRRMQIGTSGIDDEKDRHWYASVLLGRLMFVWFLQKKGLLDKGDTKYLNNKLRASKQRGSNRFFGEFLKRLFFEGLAKDEDDRAVQAKRMLGEIPYVNGGLFIHHEIEEKYSSIDVDDKSFEMAISLFQNYSWHLNDIPSEQDNEINPSILGYIFEKYINQKSFGAYYTPKEITKYLCRRSIYQSIVNQAAGKSAAGQDGDWQENFNDLLAGLDLRLCKRLLDEILPDMSILDPACGSGAFLVEAMHTMHEVYMAAIGRLRMLDAAEAARKISQLQGQHVSLDYAIKRRIVTGNLYGVDIMPEAVEICRLRLFLALIASEQEYDRIEPLPNIDFNVLSGNSLIGLLQVHDSDINKKKLVGRTFRELVNEYEQSKQEYRLAQGDPKQLESKRQEIEKIRSICSTPLNELLIDKFRAKNIRSQTFFRQPDTGKICKKVEKGICEQDIAYLKPFHWGFEFNRIMNEKGGFDVILANPPWEIFKPNAKEFFSNYSEDVFKKKITKSEFEKLQEKLLDKKEIEDKWLAYQSAYPLQSAWFRKAEQFVNQSSLIEDPITGKQEKAGSDINLYKLFLEQGCNLLHPGGTCGIVLPAGIYSDLGAKGLRKMLFEKNTVTGLIGFENRKYVFEGVHRSFKFVVLTFEKDGTTAEFPAAFMRTKVGDLDEFPRKHSAQVKIDSVKKMSPISLRLLEINDPAELAIIDKMMKFPMLGRILEGKWQLRLSSEFHATNDRYLFKTEQSLLSEGWSRAGERWMRKKERCLPVYEGRLIHQFDHQWNRSGAKIKHWIHESEARKKLDAAAGPGRTLDYQRHRLGFRLVARNTDERTMIMTVLPKGIFCANSLQNGVIAADLPQQDTDALMLWICALCNSFVVDFLMRKRVSSSINFFNVEQLPIPRVDSTDPFAREIAARAAKLICVCPEFDDLKASMDLGESASDKGNVVERMKIRAQIDARVARLYGLNEQEFSHVLDSFPLVDERIKNSTRNAFRDVSG